MTTPQPSAETVAAVRPFVPLLRRARAAGYDRISYSGSFVGGAEYVWRRDSSGYASLYGGPVHEHRLQFEREARPGADHTADFRVRLDANTLAPATVTALAEQFGFLATRRAGTVRPKLYLHATVA